MNGDLPAWLDAQNILYEVFDREVVNIPGFGKLFAADLSGVDSIFRGKGENLCFNLMENPDVLMEEEIFHVAFPFGRNWYYYDLRESFSLNILKYIGRPKPLRHSVPYVNLGVHTPYELLNAAGSIETWCRKAVWLGHRALGICDCNTMAATLLLQKACAAAGLKHIFGYTLTMVQDKMPVEVKVYALNDTGLHNLLRIQRAVMVDSAEHLLDYGRLLAYAEGCVLVLATASAYWITAHPSQTERLLQCFEAVYYQIDAAEYKAERMDREQLLALRHYFQHCYDAETDRFAIEPILLSDCYYPDRDDASAKVVVNKIATGVAHRQSDDRYFKSVDEHYDTLRPLFSERWDFDALFARMCRHTVEIAERAEAAFETGRMFMPEYSMREEEQNRYGTRRTMFLRLLDEGLEQKIPAVEHPRYRQRLDEEVYVIESTDNVDYFLIQWDMVQEAGRRNIATGIGRGSAGGSLVAYLLGITSLDPIKYDLLFSRFLVPERCGLQWKERISVLAPDLSLTRGCRYAEVGMNGTKYPFFSRAQLCIVRQGAERIVSADQLMRGDELLFDRRDLLWNLPEWNADMKTSANHGLTVTDIAIKRAVEPMSVLDAFVDRGLVCGGHASFPDIDVDYASDRRQEMKEYLEARYNTKGRRRVFSAGTFTTLKLKAALKDVSRVHRIPHSTVNDITSLIDDNADWTGLFRIAANNRKICTFIHDYPEVIEDIRLLLGQPKAASVHASAIIVTPEKRDGADVDCFDFLPIRDMDGMPVSEFDGYSVEEIGLLKEDVLATKELAKLSAILTFVRDRYGRKLSLETISRDMLDDEKTYRLLSAGYTQHIFQFSSPGITRFIREVQPVCIEDLIAVNALFRPATLEVGATEEYIRCRRGEKVPVYNYGCYEATKNTCGIMVYQEQFMSVAHTLGGFDLGKTDLLRKAIGKKNTALMASLKADFIAGATRNGCTQCEAEEIWHKIERAGSYSFNRSHAAAYALTAYCGAWLKANFPAAFYTVALQWAEERELPTLVAEMEHCSTVRIVPPDINHSTAEFHTDDAATSIYWSLTCIRQIGVRCAEFIVAERQHGTFTNVEDFIDRIFRKGISRRSRTRNTSASRAETMRIPVGVHHVKNLILAGCFDSLENCQSIIARASILKRAAAKLGIELNAQEFPPDQCDKPYFWAQQQLAVSGLGRVDYHRIFENSPNRNDVGTAEYIALVDVPKAENDGRRVAVCATVSEVSEHVYTDRATGEARCYARLLLSQNTRTVECLCWEDFYKPRRSAIQAAKDKIVILTAKIQYSDFRAVNTLQTTKNSRLFIQS